MNDENEFLNLSGLQHYHDKLKTNIDSKFQEREEKYIGYTDDTSYEMFEEVT